MPTLSIHLSNKHNIQHNINPLVRKCLQHENGYNINHERTKDNYIYIPTNKLAKSDTALLKEVLKANGAEAMLKSEINTYNTTKRKSRHIHYNDLFNNQKKQHFTIKEAIFQLGTPEDPVPEEKLHNFYIEAANDFLQSNPGIQILSFAIHYDEGYPHAHLDFYIMEPARDRKTGLKINFSLDKALGGGRENFSLWREKLENELIQKAKLLNIEVQQTRAGERHEDPKHFNYLSRNRSSPERSQPLAGDRKRDPYGDMF